MERQWEKVQSGPKVDKKFEDKGGGGSAVLADKGLDCTVEESEERVRVLRVGTQQRGSSKSESSKSKNCQEF